MTVAIARVTLFVAGSHSLKEKRAVVRRVKDLVQQKFNVSVAEVGAQGTMDVWQRAVMGFSLVGNDKRFVESSLDQLLEFVRSKAEVLGEEREVQTFNDGEPLAMGEPAYKHWEPR
jgi:uncharacterized protein YlxP (DUF503 family)